MILPPTGPCACEVVRQVDADSYDLTGDAHEHAEFPPFACSDCDCKGWRPHTESEKRPDSPPKPPDRPPAVTLPSELGFARQRSSQHGAWLDEIVASIPADTKPTDALAVCHLADMLQANWPEQLDPYDVLAVAALRIASEPTIAARAAAAVRRLRRPNR